MIKHLYLLKIFIRLKCIFYMFYNKTKVTFYEKCLISFPIFFQILTVKLCYKIWRLTVRLFCLESLKMCLCTMDIFKMEIFHRNIKGDTYEVMKYVIIFICMEGLIGGRLKGQDIYIHITDTCCHTAEANMTL